MSDAFEPITVIIISRNRPIYLWACLDSLYRHTRHAARFVLVDNQSDDPGVRSVVAGFERRGMLAATEWHDSNSPKRVAEAVARYRDSPGEYLVVIESDVMVFDTDPCWLSRMRNLMNTHPEIGILGSYIDGRDFVDPARGRQAAPHLDEHSFNRVIKATSSERSLPLDPPPEEVIDPFNPPGRLAMLRKSIIDAVPYGTDTFVYQQAKAAGIRAGIATQVRHRHLSLINIFDYPDYDVHARDEFVRANLTGTPVAALDPQRGST
jgi:hypothetical protein